MQILDIDLDFFQDQLHLNLADDKNKRLSAEEAQPWETEKVITFLEKNTFSYPFDVYDIKV